MGAGGAGGPGGAYGTRYYHNDAYAARYGDVNADAYRYRTYDAAGYAAYADAWQPTRVVSTSLYTHPGYAELARGLGLPAQPVPYDYGANVVVQPQSVYVNGDAAGSPQQYAGQAQQIATAGQSAQPSDESKWLPLGVFMVLSDDQSTSDDVFQLAVNPQRVLRGNYHNLKTDEMTAIAGSVDLQSQRAAWTIGGDQAPVYEAGVANLTKDSTPILVHLATGATNQLTLVRMQQPPAGNTAATGQQ